VVIVPTRTLAILPVLGILAAAALGLWAAEAAQSALPIVVLADESALVLCVAILLRPAVGISCFVVVAMVLPFAVVPARLLVAPTFVDLTLGVTLASWIATSLLRPRPLILSATHLVLLAVCGLVLVAAILGAAFSPLTSETLRLVLKLINAMLVFFSVTQLFNGDSQVRSVVRLIVGCGAVGALLALVIYYLPFNAAVATLSALGDLGYPGGPEVVRFLAGTDVVRATGTAVDPNILGGTLMMSGLLGLGLLVGERIRWRQVLLALALLLTLIAMGLSASRGAWVGFSGGLLFLGLFHDRRVLFVAAMIGGMLLATPAGQAAAARLATGIRTQDPAAAMRIDEYRNAWTIIQDNPTIGVGFGESPIRGVGLGVSNLYLEVAEEAGVPAAMLLLCAIGLVGRRALRANNSPSNGSSDILPGLEAALVGCLVAGLFDHYFFDIHFPHMAGLLWLCLGLLFVAIRYSTSEGQAPHMGPLPAQDLERLHD